MDIIDQIKSIRERLVEGAYANEAAVSVGVVLPVLRRLGWDDSNPEQLVPEFSAGGGRVDFALFGSPRQPSVFVEVKGIGRLGSGDKQLFEYAFHSGVPICVLTDGKTWNFYYPAGEGDYSSRRVRQIDLSERTPQEASEIFIRYLKRDRVRIGLARDAVDSDFRDLRARREAQRSIPLAWSKLVDEPEDLLVELLQDQTEAISGIRPTTLAALGFLKSLSPNPNTATISSVGPASPSGPKLRIPPSEKITTPPIQSEVTTPHGRSIEYQYRGKILEARNASDAIVSVLSMIAKEFPTKVDEIAKNVKGKSRNHIGRSPEQIYPKRPDLARAAEFFDGWLLGLNIANREKQRIAKIACETVGLQFGRDLVIRFPNAD